MRKYFDDHFFQLIADCLHTFRKHACLQKNIKHKQNNNNNNNSTNTIFFECMLLPKKQYKFTASDTHGHHSLLN